MNIKSKTWPSVIIFIIFSIFTNKSIAQPEYTECLFSLGEFNVYYGTDNYDFIRANWSHKANGAFTDNTTFNGTINSTYFDDALKVTGTVKLEFSQGLNDLNKITLDLTEEWTHISSGGSKSTSTQEVTFVAENIPQAWQSGSIAYNIYGDEICNNITELTWKINSDFRQDESIRHECKSTSEIFVELDYTPFKPERDELVTAGEEYTLEWYLTANTNAVDILLSTDDGKTFTPIAEGVLNSGAYTWDVPENILSRKCQIQIRESADQNNFVQSGIFKIKGYVLTRITANGDYETFQRGEDGWSYDNNSSIQMWPDKEHVDYKTATDPITGKKYPRFFTEHPINALERDFPSWPLFVETFGSDYCYINNLTKTYNLTAVKKWAAIKKNWHGSCVGFSLTSLLIFQNETGFQNKYPINKQDELYKLPLNDFRRKVINKFQVHNRFDAQIEYIAQNSNKKTPNQILEDLKQMLLNEDRSGDRYLVMIKRDHRFSHAVVPYKLKKHETIDTAYWLYIYDAGYPNLDEKVRFGTLSNTWWGEFDPDDWQGTNKGLYLSEPAITHLNYPGITNSPLKKTNKAIQLEYIEFYNPNYSDIILTDQNGNKIGCADSVIYNDQSPGIPILPIGGGPERPEGYLLPVGQYDITLSNSKDSLSSLSIFTDSMVYSYWRSDADSTQTDNLKWGNSISLKNSDNQPKSTNLEMVITRESDELAINVLNLTISQDDSLDLSVTENQNLGITNHGGNSAYNLRLRIASEEGESFFEHANISVANNSTQKIEPDWSNLNEEAITIFVDNDNDGSFDDTLTVENEIVVGVKEKSETNYPYSFNLEQNYPNPFNPETKIRFQIPNSGHIILRIYNLFGQEIRTLVDQHYATGEYSIQWDGKNSKGETIASGLYLYKLQVGDFSQTRKMMLLR